jgi:hypothetical protein
MDTISRESLSRVQSIRLVRAEGALGAIPADSAFTYGHRLQQLADRRLRGNPGSSIGRPRRAGCSPATDRKSNISRKCIAFPSCRIACKRSSLWMSFRRPPASPLLDIRTHPRGRQAPSEQRMAERISQGQEIARKISTVSRSWPFPRAGRVARPRSARFPQTQSRARETKARDRRRSRRRPRPMCPARAKSSAQARLRLPS